MTITLIAVLIAADITALLGCIAWRLNHRYIKITPVEIKQWHIDEPSKE